MKAFILRIVAIAFIVPVLLPATVRAQGKTEKPAAKAATEKAEPFKPQQ